MKLLSLELENIRSYNKLNLSFPSGSILFRGDMGSGKSTILMAIEFALFGSSNLIKNLVSKKEQRGEIVLRFDVDGVECEIGRSIYKKNNKPSQSSKESYIVVNGVKEPLAVSDLKLRVLEILGFNELVNPRANSRVYRYAVYIPQEEIKSIVENKDREEIIRQAFGMEDYNTSIDNVKKIVKDMKHNNEMTAIRFEKLNEYNTTIQERRASLTELNNEMSQYNNNESDLVAQQDAVQSEIDKTRSELDEIIKLKAESEQLKSTISDDIKDQTSYKRDVERQKSELDKLDIVIAQYDSIKPPTTKPVHDINGLLREVKNKEIQYRVADENSKKIKKDIKTIERQLEGHTIHKISNMISNLESKINSNNLQLSDITNQKTTKNHELGAQRQQAKTLTENLKRALALGSRCDVCESELDPTSIMKLRTSRQSSLDKTNEEINAIENSIKELQSQISDITGQIQHDTESLSTYKIMEGYATDEARLQDELKELSVGMRLIKPDDYTVDGFSIKPSESAHEYLDRLSTALLNYDHSMDILAEKYKTKATLETNLDNTQKSYQNITLKITSEQNRLTDVLSEISKSDAVEKQHNLTREKKLEIGEEIKRNAQNISTVRERTISIKNEIDTLESDIMIAEEYKAQYCLHKDSIKWLEEYYIPAVITIDKKTKNSLRYDFNQFYKEWYDMLIDDPTKTSVIDEQFGPELSQDGYDMYIDGLSGGEKTSVALAYRLALNSTIRRQTNILKSNLLILDEPTDGFSHHQMGKVRTIFESLRCEQVIMVSHEVEMEGYVDHVFRVTKTEGASSIHEM